MRFFVAAHEQIGQVDRSWPRRRTVRATEVDDLKMQLRPVRGGEEPFQRLLGLADVASVREPPTRGKPVDVRVDGEGRLAEGLHHHHARALVTDAGQRLEFMEGVGHAPAVCVDQDPAQRPDVLRLRGREPAGADDAADLRDAEFEHLLRCRRARKQARRHLAHALVGALRGQYDRDQQRVGIALAKRLRRPWLQLVQDLRDSLGLLGASHAPKNSVASR